MDMERAKETVRKLMNLAKNDGALDGEIANAMAFAKKIMDEHHITLTDIEDVDETLEDLKRKAFSEGIVTTSFTRQARWEYTLAHFVCKLVGGVQYWFYSDVTRDKIAGKGCLHFYGVEEDVQLAQELFNECRLIIATAATLRYKTFSGGAGRNYCEGFAYGLYSQLEKANKQELLEKSTGTALMVLNTRKEIVKRKEELGTNYLAEVKGIKKLKTRKGTANPNQDARAWRQGHEDGKSHQATVDRKKKLQ